jgi:energy-coupling factor transporter ATP-binding protein EcfA2
MAESTNKTKGSHRWVRLYDLVVRKLGLWLWTAVIIAALVSGTVAWAFTPSNTDFSKYPIGMAFVWIHDHRLGLLIGVGCVLAVLLFLTACRFHTHQPTSPPNVVSLTLENRTRQLTRLRSLYQDAIKQSLWGMARLELGLERTFDATTHPGLFVSYRPSDAREAIAPGTSLLEVFDQAGDGLLILGKPGAGKSTLLLDLALALTERAEHDATQPLPVLTTLTTWLTKISFDKWLTYDLSIRYQISADLIADWLQDGSVLPLLDGLDEMAEEARSDCISAINTYRQEHQLPLVICSRVEEYFSQGGRLSLQSAIELQPLTGTQVRHYLADGKRSLAAVRALLRQNAALQELLTTPLMLSVIILAYRDKAVKDLARLGTAEELQQRIFARFIQRMLERTLAQEQITSQQMRYWLTHIAQRMQGRHRTEFTEEDLLDPQYLTKRTRAVYFWLPGLFIGVLAGLLTALLYVAPNPVSYRLSSSVVGLVTGALFIALTNNEIRLMLSPKRWGSPAIVSSILRFLTLKGMHIWIRIEWVLILSLKLIIDLLTKPYYGLFPKPILGFIGLLCIILLSFLLAGGRAERRLSRLTLRVLLWQKNAIPRHYTQLLDEACRRILLQRARIQEGRFIRPLFQIGFEGYRFIHPLFQEYFASGAAIALPNDPASPVAKGGSEYR